MYNGLVKKIFDKKWKKFGIFGLASSCLFALINFGVDSEIQKFQSNAILELRNLGVKYCSEMIDKGYLKNAKFENIFQYILSSNRLELFHFGVDVLSSINSKSYSDVVENITTNKNIPLNVFISLMLKSKDSGVCNALVNSLQNENIITYKNFFKKSKDVDSSVECDVTNESEHIDQKLGEIIDSIPKSYLSYCNNYLMEKFKHDNDWNVLTHVDRSLFAGSLSDNMMICEETPSISCEKIHSNLKIIKDVMLSNPNDDKTKIMSKPFIWDLLLLCIMKYYDNFSILHTICEILQCLSLNEKNLSQFKSFLPFLYFSLKRNNVILNAYAKTILTNLDKSNNTKFFNGVTLIHQANYNQDDNIDVVFVHGLGAKHLRTWRTGNLKEDKDIYVFWPKDWLATDISNLRIICISFDSQFLKWDLDCPMSKFSVPMTTKRMMNLLVNANIGSYPTVWVGHSIGGIIIKNIITESFTSKNNNFKKISDCTVGTVFYSVPHHGSPNVHLLNLIFPAFDTNNVSSNDTFVHDLNKNFLNFLIKKHVYCLNFAETVPYHIAKLYPLVIVPPENSDIGYGEFHVLEKGHSETCKPTDKSDVAYTATRDFIQNIVNKVTQTAL